MKVKLPALLEGSTFARGTAISGVTVSAAQRADNARVIYQEFRRAGYPAGLALVAIANAIHESDLSNYAAGDSGQSIGLFQLKAPSGAGAGMSIEQRQDPVLNTRRIIEKMKEDGAALFASYDAGASVAELSRIFGRDVEQGSGSRDRGETARKAFGATIADASAKKLTYVAVAAQAGLIVGASVVAAVGLVLLWRYTRRAT